MKVGAIVGGMFVVVVVVLFQFAGAQDTPLNAVSDCVVATAHAEGYSGNVYSQEAWSLFAGNCE